MKQISCFLITLFLIRKGINMSKPNTLVIEKDQPFKIRWMFTTESGEKVNRTCQVLFTGVTLPSENGVSYEILNIKQQTVTDLTAEELSSMYVTTAAADSVTIQLPA